MVSRNVFVLLVLCTLTFASSLYASETAGQKEIGRYQLFQGTFTTLDLKYRQTSSTHNGVFLLDTATGLVKRYVNRIDEDGRYVETWLATDINQQLDPKKKVTPQNEGK